jgi:signal transduction histidine kinase
LTGLVFLLAIGLSLAGIPARIDELVFNKENFYPLVSGEFVVWYTLLLELILAGAFFCTAIVIVRQKPGEPLVLFLAASLAALGATETGMSDAFINPQYNPAGAAWREPVYALRSFAMGAGLILLYVFPDGRFTPRWTKPLALIWGTLNVLWFFIPTIPFNPNDGPTWRATPVASLVFGIAWFSSGIIAQLMRSRQTSDPIQREQTKWSAYGLSAAVLGGAIFYGYSALKEPFFFLVEGGLMGTLYQIVRPTIKVIGMALLPVCLGVAILRYRLFEIDLIINRTLVYTLLTGILISIYLLTAAAASAVFQTPDNLFASLLAAGVIAVLFQPLRQRLQRSANRLVYGERDDPYHLLSSLGEKLENTFAPQATLSAIVETIGRGLKLPYVAIVTPLEDGWKMEAEYRPASPGKAAPDSVQAAPDPVQAAPDLARLENWPGTVMPISYQGRLVGRLLLSPRSPGESFSRSDRRILEDLARQTGAAVHAIQLQENLQLARQRLVNAREEERRRLRRDLHDGLGPTLASLTFQVDAARNLLRRDPDQADSLLESVACQTQEMIGDIRQLVYNLRPPALDELGLLAALEELASAKARQQPGLQISFQGPEELPALPAAVEVAAYRIVSEALTNVTRHAQARRCLVQIRQEENALLIEVQDDGQGLRDLRTRDLRTGEELRSPDLPVSGAGLQTMRERAIELGGSFEIQSAPNKGVCIVARLPLPWPRAAGTPETPVNETRNSAMP